jgi:CAAX protease family protein
MVSGSRTTRDIWTFLTLLFVFGGAFYALVLLRPGAPKQWGTYALPFMWCPGLAALITKLVRDRTLRGLGWGWGRTHYFLIAYGLAIAICLLPYLVVWFAFEAFNGSQLVEAFAKEGLPSALRGQAAMLAVVLVLLPLTGLIAQPARRSAGGAFSSRMHALVGFTGTSLLVGLIWAAWHYPINIAVLPIYCPNVPRWYSNACFTLVVIGLSFMHTWLRLRSNSLWPLGLVSRRGQCVPEHPAGCDARDQRHLIPDH